ncbi:MAG: acyl-CoA thioesterase [Dehalococcoidia bacterium]|nr:acyl-CoA thioesterase [Dehalococcoidia bacterium]
MLGRLLLIISSCNSALLSYLSQRQERDWHLSRYDFRFSCTERVRWSDCDAQGIVFNGSYFDYLEVAQADYFRNLGFVLYDPDGRRHFDTATVKATLEYISPARVDDLIEICWKVERIGNSSLTTRSEIHNRASGDLLLRAEIIYVNFDSDASVSRRVPDDLRTLIETYEKTGEIIPLDKLPGLAGLARRA